MITVAFTIVSALAAFGMARAARRRSWPLHAITAYICGALLTFAAVLLATRGSLPELPPWSMLVHFAVNVFLAAIVADLSCSGRRNRAAGERR